MSIEYPANEPAGTPPWINAGGAQPEAFGVAVAAAVGVAILGVIGWIVLAEAFRIQTAFVAFGVAIGTAAAFRRFAPRNATAPTLVVVLTVASALVGLLGSQYALLAHDAHVSYLTAVRGVPVSKIPDLMKDGTNAFTWVIVALSGLTGYRQSQRLRMHQQRFGSGPPRPPAQPPVFPSAM
jgi:hypothetical protein